MILKSSEITNHKHQQHHVNFNQVSFDVLCKSWMSSLHVPLRAMVPALRCTSAGAPVTWVTDIDHVEEYVAYANHVQ